MIQMQKSKVVFLFMIACCLMMVASSQTNSSSAKPMKQLIDDDLKFAAQQYKVLIKNTPKDSMPKTFEPAKKRIGLQRYLLVVQRFLPGNTLVYL